jgi:hypothetical protein
LGRFIFAPWSFNFHGAAKVSAISGLQFFVHRVMDHNWQWLFGLSCMPLAFRL